MNTLGIFLVAVSFFIIVLVLVSARLTSQQQLLRDTDQTPVPVNLASVNNAVLSARVGGQITYINDVAFRWFDMEGADPDLWTLASKADPPDAFLELFAAEGQAEFAVNGRPTQATSHRVAVGDEVQFVVTISEETPLPTLERTERGSAKALQVISEIGQAINAPLQLDGTLEATLNGVNRLMPFDFGQITLWNQDGEVLQPVMRVGPNDYVQAATTQSFAPGDGYSGWIAGRRRALLIDDIVNERDIDRNARPTDPLAGSYLGVPLTVRNRFIGTIELGATKPNHYDREDLAVLTLIAEQAAIAIENARRYSAQAERVAELSGLQRIAEAISVLQDPYQLYAQLSQRVAELMDTDMAGVLLWNREMERLIAQRPIHGVADSLTSRYNIPLERGSPARSLWEDVAFWYSNNITEDHLVQELGMGMLAEMTGVRTTAMATMTVGEERIGVLQVANKRDGSNFTLEDIRLLQIYANQASIVVESARLYGQEQTRVAELEGLQQISQAMSAFTDPEELYGQLTRRIAELVGVDICGVLIYEQATDHLVARPPFYGVRRELVENYTIPVGKRGLPRDLWREKDYFLSNTATSDNSIDNLEMRDVVRDSAMQTLMLAPLAAGGRRFGMLHVANKTNRTEFDEDDIRLVTIFASQASALIENARLYQDTDATLRKRASELRSVSRISRELNATLELERILEVIASEAQQAEGADFGNLVMFEWQEDYDSIEPTMIFGEELGEEARMLELSCARSGEVVEITDFEKVPSFPSPKSGTRSALIVPIHFEGKVVGVIGLYSRTAGGLGQSAREYAQAISSQATAAVTNATRYQEQLERSELLRRRAEQLTQIFELGRMFRSDQSVEGNLTSVARAIKESVGFERVVITIAHPENEVFVPMAHTGLSENAFATISEQEVPYNIVQDVMTADNRLSGSYLVPASESAPLAVSMGLGAEEIYDSPTRDASSISGEWKAGAVLIVPLRAASDELIGVLIADRPADGKIPTRNTIELLEIFGNQAAITVDNSRLYQSVEERAEELTKSLEDLERSYTELDKLSHEMIRKDAELSQVNELLNLRASRLLALHRIMETVDTTRDPITVLQAITDSVVEEMDIDQCVVMLAEDGHLKTVAASGEVPGFEMIDELVAGDERITEAFEANEARMVIPGKRRSEATTRLMRNLKAETLIATPMQLEGAREGVLVVGSSRPGAAFGDDDRDLFNLLASQIAVEFENAQLYGAVQTEAATAASERDRLQQLHLITTALQQANTLEERLGVVARGIKSVGWGRVAVALLDGGTEGVAHMATAGYDDSSEEGAERQIIEATALWNDMRADQELMEMRIGSSYYLPHDHPWVQQKINGASSSSASSGSSNGRGWHPEDLLYLPMYSGQEVIGVISLREPANDDPPTEASLRPLELFVQQASSAIENARLYQETLELQSYNEAVVQSIQQGIIVLSPSFEVESVNQYIRDEFDWDESQHHVHLHEWRPDFADMGITEGVLNTVREGRPAEMPKLRTEKDGEARYFNASAYPRYDESDTVTGIVILMEDITQRARLEADIARRGQQLAALSEASRRITANLTVNDVVNSALGQAEEVIPYDRVSIWTRSFEYDNALQLSAAAGFIEEPPEVLHVADEQGLGDILEYQTSALIVDKNAAELYPAENPYRTWMGVPMISGGNMIGVIIFENKAPHMLAPADEQVAAAFANQVGVALENARLFEEVAENASELHSRTQRLALLNRISSTIGQSLDQTSILQTAVDELTVGVNGERGDVFMVEQGGDTAQLSIQYPSTPDGTVDDVSIPISGNPAMNWLLRERSPLPVEDIHEDERLDAMRDQLVERGAASVLLIPLTIGNNLVALIAVHNPEQRAFNTDQIELAQTVTNQVAVSIQNAQLFQETVARQRELSILFEAGRIASASLDLNTVATNAANYFIRSLDVDGSAVYLAESQTLVPLADVEKGEDVSERETLHLEEYPALRSVVNDRGVLALRQEDDALSERERDYLKARQAYTALMVPLTTRDEIIGVAELRARSSSRNFSQGDIKLVRALATSIATAMENARLHDETQQRVDELSIINEISRGLTQTISQEDLFRILQEQIADVLNANSMTIARYDERTDVWTFPLAIENNERVDRSPSAGRNLYSYVAETREPLILRGSVEKFREEHALIDAVSAAQSFAAVPLQTGEKVIGVMALEDYDRADAFDDTDLRVLGPIAAQVAVSIENTRLYGELQQRLSETTTLQEVSRVVNSALDLQEIFERVVSELADAFAYPIVGLYTLEGRELLMQASQGYGDEKNVERMRVVGVEEGIIGRVVSSGVGEYVVDVRDDDNYIPVENWVRSMVAVPIISDEFVLGVLTVQSGADRLLGENDLELLRTFAGQVATAMVNASLYTQMVELSEELERRVEERTEELSAERDRIDTLFRITVELTASLDLDRVLNRALSLVGQAIGAEYGALFLVDPQSDLLIYRAAMQESEIIPPGGRQIEMRKDTGMAGWVMKNRQSLIVGNVKEDDRWEDVPGTEERRSLLGAPLISSETVLGCLFFTSNEIDKFNQGHLQLVEAAANQVATAINNAELYRLIRDQAERLGVMLRSQQTEAAKSQAILESIADGVMVSDSTGEIILFNAAAERILDLRRDEVLGRPAADLTGLYGQGAQVWADMLDSFDETADDLESGEFVTAQLQIGNKYVQVNVAAVMHGAENLGLVSVFRDITREVAADRAKSEFVANVSHELRTPMTSIKGYADLLLLQAAGEINEDQRRFLAVIKQNADRLTSLVNDLLTISSIEQRDIDLDIRDIAIAEVINDVVFAIEGRMSGDGAKQINIRSEISEDLDTLEGDYDRITQIVTNLVSNSYQYTEDGGQIVISAYEEAGGVRIDVADTGIGIPYEQQDRIFERFFRGVENPMVMATAGTGLGLSIVQHLIDMHSGRISFESEPGVGTTFSVWLPYEFTEDTGDNLDTFTAIRE